MSDDVTPSGAQSLDDLAARLTELRVRAGGPSYAEIARRISVLRTRRGIRTAPPGRITVYDVFRTGRSRMDIELVADVVAVLGRSDDVVHWRHAHAGILRRRAVERNGRLTAARGRVEALESPVAPALFGREREVEHVVDLLLSRRDHDEGASRLAVISGLPGVGKTSVARAIAARVVEALPGASLIEAALLTHAGGGSTERVEPGDLADEIMQLHRGLAKTAAGPLVVLLDDAATVDDFGVVAGALPEDSVLIATSRRELSVPEQVITVVLDPLDRAAAAKVLRERVDPGSTEDAAALEKLAELCGGLPLALVMLAGQIGEHAGWSLEDHVHRLEHSASTTRTPSLLLAYDELSAPSRRALHLLSRHPGRLTARDVHDYLGVIAARAPEWSVDDVLSELRRDRFIDLDDGRHSLHDLVRTLAAERAVVDEPLSLRREAAESLVRAHIARLTSDVIDPESIVQFVIDTETYVTTAQLAAECGLGDTVADYAMALRPWFVTTVDWMDVLRVMEYARRVASADRRAGIERVLGGALVSLGRADEAEVILTRLLADDVDDPERHRTLSALGSVAAVMGDFERCRELSQEALAGALAAGDTASIASASGQTAESLTELCRPEEAVALLEPLLASLGEHAGDQHYLAVHVELSLAYLAADRLQDAQERAALAEVLSTRAGHVGLATFAGACRARVMCELGEVAHGREILERVEVEFADLNRHHVRTEVKIILARARLLDGDAGAAADMAREAVELAEAFHFPLQAEFARLALASAELAVGRLDEAENLARGVLANSHDLAARAEALAQLGLVAHARGESSKARSWWSQVLDVGPTPLLARKVRTLLDESAEAPSGPVRSAAGDSARGGLWG